MMLFILMRFYIVELVLDSGEKRFTRTGDVLIHRGTVH